jgi:hypothetical protein
MGTVYYLCYSDIPEKTGLVFPAELEPDSYSPGIWTVAIKRHDRFPEIFQFDALNDNQIISTKLARVSRSVYQVDTEKHGIFFFRINNLYHRYQSYVGNSKLIEQSDRLFQLTSIDIQKLERTCDKGFFFVGRVDNNLENRRKR